MFTQEGNPPMTTRTIDDIPVAYTPDGGWSTWPAPVLAGCTEPLQDDAPDLRGIWQTVEVFVDDQVVADHPAVGRVSRKEQAGDRVVITGSGIIHDMRCDGTLDNGVHDVAFHDFTTPVHVVATYEDGVHVLRPDGVDVEVKRWREGDDLMWQYVGFTARMRRLGPPDADPAELIGQQS